MVFGLFSFVLVAIVLHRKLCDATPVTLTGNSGFKTGDNLELSCSVNESVDLFSVSFFKNMIETIWINNPASCTFFNLIPDDTSTYSIICDPSQKNFTMIKNGLNTSDDNAVWFCRMVSKAGGNGSCPVANNTCTSLSIILKMIVPTTPATSGPSSTTTTTTTTVTSSSTPMSSATSSLTIDYTSTKPTTNGSAATDTFITSTSTNPTSGSTNTNNSTSNKSKSISSDSDIKVIVPAVVVPCGLLIIGNIILVICCVRRRRGKNVRESPDGMAIQDKGNTIEGWKQSQGHGKATDNLDAVYTTPDGFVIFPGPAAMSTARSYKDKKHHDGTDQYSRPYAGPYHHKAEYFPRTNTSNKAYTHKDKKHDGVTDQYSRPYMGTYGYQAANIPNTYMSTRTYAQWGKKYDYGGPVHQQASHQMAAIRPAYGQTTYYPQTGHYGQSHQDVYYSGGRQYSYEKSSKSHYDNSGRKQQQEYYNQYEMADYGGNRAGYRHTKQDTAFYY